MSKNINLFLYSIAATQGSADIWRFIEGLNWLNPSLAISVGNTTPKKLVHVPFTRIKNDNALLWIYENLSFLTLSARLRWLISDFEHLSNCYEVTAFLRNEKYTQALILCLQAIEQNQPNLIDQIDARLYSNLELEMKQHKRSSSHPNFSLCPPPPSSSLHNRSSKKPPISPHRAKLQKTISAVDSPNKKLKKLFKFRPWSSLPNLLSTSPQIRSRSKTISQPIGIPTTRPTRLTADALKQFETKDFQQRNAPSFSYRQFQSESGGSSGGQLLENHLKPITIVKCDDIEIHLDRKYTSPREGTSPATQDTLHMKHPNNLTRTPSRGKSSLFPSFFMESDHEDGEQPSTSKSFFSKSAPSDLVSAFVPQVGVKLKSSHSMHPAISLDGQLSFPQSSGTGYFPRPTQGQSLASFLQTAQFSRTNTDLDRENAHFSVAEAMISAIEQLKWTRFEKQTLKSSWSESGGEEKGTKNGKAEGRKRRRHKLKICSENVGQDSNSPPTDSSDNDSTYSSVSADLNSDENSDDENGQDSGNLSYLRTLSVSNHSVNDHTAYAEWGETTREALSAEGVALSLISKFGDKQLPRASELRWLVSEQDAPQQLLPMPSSWSVNPDIKYNSFLRGTRDWAPPRAQIIFTRHPTPE